MLSPAPRSPARSCLRGARSRRRERTSSGPRRPNGERRPCPGIASEPRSLLPTHRGTTYTSLWSPVSSYVYQRYVTSGFPHLIGFAHLPGGSVLDAWQFSYCDTSSGPTHMTISLYSCDDLGTCGAPPVYSFDTGTVGPACWSTQISGGPFGFTVDNKTSEYMVDVVFGTLDGSQTIASTSFGYRLQVSPGPGSATFNDVPVSDPAFQYVEALVASGITAG